ncbi:MAG: hypothetical protein C0421_15940 [Hyphomonas sp.]|uniref:hypothetical protein n=1 Tax=Hyphomonas sp. TaxID=87 RepID=UPI0025B96B0E|nr:hypothetical protein [Hyphomonas sp.]MBA4340321.1 hypothetical protein [Hyphomonas sp.]
MNVTHAPRAILRLETKRSDLAAFEIIGKISEAVMAWMAEQLDRAFDLHQAAAAWQWIEDGREELRA